MPEIVTREGRVKVLDFGLAKRKTWQMIWVGVTATVLLGLALSFADRLHLGLPAPPPPSSASASCRAPSNPPASGPMAKTVNLSQRMAGGRPEIFVLQFRLEFPAGKPLLRRNLGTTTITKLRLSPDSALLAQHTVRRGVLAQKAEEAQPRDLSTSSRTASAWRPLSR